MTGTPDARRKMAAARLSVAAALVLSAFKLTAGFLFESLGVLSAGVDSVIDLVASSISYLSMRKSIEPADQEHPYGHGKIENLASFFQAGFIGLMGLVLIGEGVRRMLMDGDPPRLGAGIAVMLVSGAASFFVGRHLAGIGRETDSPLLKADSLHFLTDTYTNLGVALALVLAAWSGYIFFDRLAALLIGAWVLIAAYRIFRRALDALTDTYIPKELREEIDRIILSHMPQIMGYHKLRTRHAGSQKLIDLHLVTCKDMVVEEAHRITDHIEKEIESRIRNSDVIIHIEPCGEPCPEKPEECLYLSCRPDSIASHEPTEPPPRPNAHH